MTFTHDYDIQIIVLNDKLIIDSELELDTYAIRNKYGKVPVFIFYGRDKLKLKQFLNEDKISKLPVYIKCYDMYFMPCRQMVNVIYNSLDLYHELKYD